MIQIHAIKRLTFYVLQFRDVNMTDGASCKHTQNIILSNTIQRQTQMKNDTGFHVLVSIELIDIY